MGINLFVLAVYALPIISSTTTADLGFIINHFRERFPIF